MVIGDLQELLDTFKSEIVITVLINGIAYPIRETQIYQAHSGNRLLLIPEIRCVGSVPSKTRRKI